MTDTLLKHSNMVLVSTSKKEYFGDIIGRDKRKDSKVLNTEDILNSILPPKEHMINK